MMLGIKLLWQEVGMMYLVELTSTRPKECHQPPVFAATIDSVASGMDQSFQR